MGIARRYHELWRESRGEDVHGHDEPINEARGVLIMDALAELQRIDRELESATTRLQALRDAAESYHHKGFLALTLEDQADELERQGDSAQASELRERARTLRHECLHWAKCREDEEQFIVGLRMERKTAEQKIEGNS